MMDVSKILGAKGVTVKGPTNGIKHLPKKHKMDHFKKKGRLTWPCDVAADLNAGRSKQLETKNVIFATGILRCWWTTPGTI